MEKKNAFFSQFLDNEFSTSDRLSRLKRTNNCFYHIGFERNTSTISLFPRFTVCWYPGKPAPTIFRRLKKWQESGCTELLIFVIHTDLTCLRKVTFGSRLEKLLSHS